MTITSITRVPADTRRRDVGHRRHTRDGSVQCSRCSTVALDNARLETELRHHRDLGSGFSATTRSAISDQVRADHVIDREDGLGFRASEGDTLAATPGVSNPSHVRSDTALVQGEEGAITGIDPATIAHFYKFNSTKGSNRTLEQLGTDGALVTKDYAETEHLAVGSRVSLTTPSGDKRTLVARGVYDLAFSVPIPVLDALQYESR